MSVNINELKRTLGVGARANRYRVIIPSKGNGPDSSLINILVKGASFPSRSFADIDIFVQGKKITIAGEAQYDGTWTLTFLDTEDHSLRGAFNNWMTYIDNINANNREAQEATDYMTDGAKIQQLSTVDNSVKAEYSFFNLYPKSISEITVADDNEGLVEFTVEFNYSYWIKSI